jgi:hypothetical protein
MMKSATISMADLHGMYGDFAPDMQEEKKIRADLRDRAAYVYVTGQFPSHLRRKYTGMLRALTHYFKKPVSLDGRTGHLKLDDEVIRDLALDSHPMVRKVREKIAAGYFIQPSLGLGTRRNFWKIFMFKLNADNIPFGHIIVQGDGSIKDGWY